MKIYFLLLILLTVNISAQKEISGIVHYESSYSQENIKNYFSKEREGLKDAKKVEFIDNLLLNSNKINSTLIFSLKEAIYKVDKKLSLKSKGNLVEKLSLLSAGGGKKYYTSSDTKTIEVQNCETLGECFIIVSKFKEWKLTQEVKIISGYTCYKAEYTEKIKEKDVTTIAWYTTEIPIGFGPKDYNGLPGLILELDNERIYFKAKKIILNPKNKVKIIKPKEGKIVSKEEFKKILLKSMPSLYKK